MEDLMIHPKIRLVLLLGIVLVCGAAAFGQTTTGSLSGTVSDPTGVVPNAVVNVKSAAGVNLTTQTNDSGTFKVPSLNAGIYTVTVTAPNYKKALITDVKVDVAKPSTLNILLEVGLEEQTVTIVGGGGELINTQNATAGSTIIGRQIIEQPQASRDALDLVTLLPGVQTTGRPRQSSVNGLPKSAINITIDGTNVQDNNIRSQDGFFTFVRPRIDAIDEVTISTATPGAESNGTGAVQIRFVTRGGTNDFNGSVYWYHREPTLSANYWYNNATLAADPKTGKAPILRVLLNQYGVRFGGPIRIPKLFDGRNKAFFFVNYEEYRLPEQQLRSRTILNTNIFGGATPGNFQYVAGGVTRTVNLLQAAGSLGLTNTVDPDIANLLNEIRSTTSQGSLAPVANAPNYQRFSFINPGGQDRYFPTVRFDFNLSKNHRLENIWNYQRFTGKPVDFLNAADPSFPGFPNHAGQDSHRFSNTTALRSTLSRNLVNEARFGLTGGNSLFGANTNASQFDNQAGFDLALSDSVNAVATLTDATANAFPLQFFRGAFGNTSNRRNTPTKTFTDNVTWIKGNHTLNFGGEWTQINAFSRNVNQVVPTIYFDVAGGDPAEDLFSDPAITSVVFPGASATQLREAAQIYALLTGRLLGTGESAFLDEDGKYTKLGLQTSRFRQREFGLFAQDSWRFRPNFTVNYGLRWQPQQAPVSLNSVFAKTDIAGVFGVSGTGRLFQPGLAAGAKPAQYTVLEPGEKLYATDWNNFAPSFGFAYSPDWKNGVLNNMFGNSGQSVIRAGYSIAFVREGLSVVLQPIQQHPGGIVDTSLNAGIDFAPGFLFRNRAALPTRPFPSKPTYPIEGNIFDGAAPSAFDPNLKTGYVQSWTLSIQRELTKDTVFEARYVGNRGIKLTRRYNINEVNTVENGFAREFLLAQQNLLANRAAGRGTNFRYFGPGTGTNPLPILLGFFTGQGAAVRNPNNPASYGSSSFANATFASQLLPSNGNVLGFASTLSVNGNTSPTTGDTFFNNGIAAGFPSNFFVANPDAILNGAAITDNGSHSWYDGVSLEVRRRLSQGLLLQGSYTWSKSLTDYFASSQSGTNSYLTQRDLSLNKRLSPFDIRHAFKVNWIYELPIGRGKTLWSGANGLVDKAVGGWEIHGTSRVQSGRAFRLGNIQLVGMTADDLQKSIEVRKQPNGTVTFLPDDIILNTRRAYNFDANSPTGYSSLGVPTGRFIAPPGYGGCTQRFIGECGFSDLVLHGPRFVRVDMSLVKRIRFGESTNLEFRAEFLNAINNQNFFVGGSPAAEPAQLTANTSVPANYNGATFGQLAVGSAYQDVSTTNDPGGRIVQFVFRFNF
jgi:hypothetical protein